MNRSARGFLLGVLFGAATAALFLLWHRRKRTAFLALPYSRPRGGEREGEHELFIGS